MEGNIKKYWKGIEELTNDEKFVKRAHSEFPDYLPVNQQSGADAEESFTNRRDFLKLMGFGMAAVSLAACEAPVKKAIPYLNKPEDIDPSIANYYASTYVNGGEYASVVIKTREGRPIKVEGNTLSPVTKGGLNARAQASVLTLYDQERLAGPTISGKLSDWTTVDNEISGQLKTIGDGKIALVSGTILSPSTKAVISMFKDAFPGTEHITYDTSSSYGILKANEAAFGRFALPTLDFSKAEVIVSVAADFLGTWIAPTSYANQFAKMRKLNSNNRRMSRLHVFESNLSLTGANADHRFAIKPSEEGAVLIDLYNKIASKAGSPTVSGAGIKLEGLDKVANDLWNARGKSLLVAGNNNPDIQKLVIAINQMLDNYGTTIDQSSNSFFRQGDDAKMGAFINGLKSGAYSAVIFYGCNPVYSHPEGRAIADALGKTKLSISFNDRADETSSLVKYICPDHHYMESWGDAEPVAGHFSLGQPVISPIFKTRQAQDSLLKWAGSDKDYLESIQSYWNTRLFGTQSKYLDFQSFWDNVLHDGVYSVGSGWKSDHVAEIAAQGIDVPAAISALASASKASGVEVKLYEKIGLGDGSQANNPWLQELPDPVTKATWDNYVTISRKHAQELGVNQDQEFSETVTVTANGYTVELPVIIQPGQAYGTIGLAIGYGREKAGKCANGVGKNVAPFATTKGGYISFEGSGVDIKPTGTSYKVAQTQTHNTVMGRNVIQESTLTAYQKDTKAGRVFFTFPSGEGLKKAHELNAWGSEHSRTNHHWGMSVDMNSCIGCGACVIACQAENNIPVVGKQEVINRREMHWMRIDRYYSTDAAEGREMEIASDNPEVVFQPMMCQHCNHAPCETVCPVLATTHSSEGLNQMTYNRCIGTRYCANNCPFKVRRFNWFKYHNNVQFEDVNVSMNNDLGKMVLNPDVTVRSRGVMEKCSFCIQKIQEGKLTAKKEKRRPIDGEINTACATTCPSEAIVFGDMNDPESRIAKLLSIKYEGDRKEVTEDRAYHVLEEINVQPNVAYLTKIRNKLA